MNAAAAFVALCAVGIPAWWLILFQSVVWRRLFVPDGAWPAFRFVVVPDVLLALATATAAIHLLAGRVSAVFAIALGGWMYATAFSIAWAASVDAPAGGPAL